MVLDAKAGPLPRMALPFRLGAGGRLGDGTQYTSWIHRDDWVRLVRHLLQRQELTGAFNAAAPEPVRNADFAKTLARSGIRVVQNRCAMSEHRFARLD